jgi:hypothetical protein
MDLAAFDRYGASVAKSLANNVVAFSFILVISFVRPYRMVMGQ